MQLVHFSDDFYDEGVVKFKAGSYQPLNSETQSLVNTGYASLVTEEDAANSATVLAALAQLSAERADAAEDAARTLRAEADAAQTLAEAAAKRQAEAIAADAQREADALTAAAAEQTRIAEVAATEAKRLADVAKQGADGNTNANP